MTKYYEKFYSFFIWESHLQCCSTFAFFHSSFIVVQKKIPQSKKTKTKKNKQQNTSIFLLHFGAMQFFGIYRNTESGKSYFSIKRKQGRSFRVCCIYIFSVHSFGRFLNPTTNVCMLYHMHLIIKGVAVSSYGGSSYTCWCMTRLLTINKFFMPQIPVTDNFWPTWHFVLLVPRYLQLMLGIQSSVGKIIYHFTS